jgi:hypothetical protein
VSEKGKLPQWARVREKRQLPGWYPDSENSHLVRHWNGTNWSPPVSIEFAHLTELAKLTEKKGSLSTIASRLTFLTWLALLLVLVSLAAGFGEGVSTS